MRSSRTHFQRQVLCFLANVLVSCWLEVQRLWHRCLYDLLPPAESGMEPKRCQRFYISLLSASVPQKEHVLWRWWWWWSRPRTSFRTAMNCTWMWHFAMLLPHLCFSSIVNRWLSNMNSQAGGGDAMDLESEARRARQRDLKTKSCRGSGVSATGLLSVRNLECSEKKVQGCSRSFDLMKSGNRKNFLRDLLNRQGTSPLRFQDRDTCHEIHQIYHHLPPFLVDLGGPLMHISCSPIFSQDSVACQQFHCTFPILPFGLLKNTQLKQRALDIMSCIFFHDQGSCAKHNRSTSVNSHCFEDGRASSHGPWWDWVAGNGKQIQSLQLMRYTNPARTKLFAWNCFVEHFETPAIE